MNTLTDKAERLAIKEIKKYGSPPLELFKISRDHAVRLAKKYKADACVCLLGYTLADFKLGLSIKENRIADHIKMSSDAARKFLRKEKLNDELIEKVTHCIEAHHGTIPFLSKEAEIVANADSYKFLTIRGVFGFIANLAIEKGYNLDQIINYADQKVDEKWQILSLPEVKKELEPNYKLIKRVIKIAKSE